MYSSWIKVDGAAVIYEQETLNIHSFRLLRCHQPVRTPFITSERKERGRTATWQDILGVGNMVPSRSKRSLLVPPMIITENQRAPFPRVIGKIAVSQSLCDEYVGV
ncbi:hypothetical protein KUCAC02_021456, partial [Chaenocephalus aceratus]